MKKKTNKELVDMVKLLERQVASYNMLFSLYVKYKGDELLFQEFLKKEISNI